MKNTSENSIKEAVPTGKVVYDKNPDNPMYYFEFDVNGKNVFLSYKMLTDSLYFGIEKQKLPTTLFSWLVENTDFKL